MDQPSTFFVAEKHGKNITIVVRKSDNTPYQGKIRASEDVCRDLMSKATHWGIFHERTHGKHSLTYKGVNYKMRVPTLIKRS
jgi:hypothetical protein